jgi:hypothetical protein
MNGLIFHLTNQCGGASQLISRKVIEVSASSPFDSTGRYSAEKLVDQDKTTYFHLKCGARQWISIDFKNMRILPTHYTLLSRSNYGANVGNLKSWILEGTDTGQGEDWFELDLRRDRPELNDRGALATFPVQSPRLCRRLRLTSTACYYHEEYLVLAGMELFGTLMIPEEL